VKYHAQDAPLVRVCFGFFTQGVDLAPL